MCAMYSDVQEKRRQFIAERSKFEDLKMVFDLGVGENLMRWRAQREDPAVRELFDLQSRIQEEKERAEELRIELDYEYAKRERQDERVAEEQRTQLLQTRHTESRRRRDDELRLVREWEEAARQQAAREARRLAEEQRAAEERRQAEERRNAEERRKQEEDDRLFAMQFAVKECSMCAQDIPEGLIFQASCCEHQFHWKCASDFARAEVGARRLEPQCPSTDGCAGRWSAVDLENATGGEMREAIDAVTMQMYMDQAGGRAWQCRRPGCRGMAEVDPEIAMIHCPYPECGFAWCQRCDCQWHADMTCEAFQQWKRENGKEGEDATMAWIRQNCKVCTRCRQAIQKTTGCNCITCKCGYQLCWICGGPAPSHNFACGHPIWS